MRENSSACEHSDNIATELATLAFSLIDRFDEVDAAIDSFLSYVGDKFGTDVIAVYELVEQGEALKCTYEWNRSGKQEHLGIEKRFVDRQVKAMHDLYGKDSDGVYMFQKGAEPLKAQTPSFPEKVKTLVQAPLYNTTSQNGLVNFINYKRQRDWSEEDIATVHTVCRVLGSYMFGIRKVDETRESLKNLVRCDIVTGLLHYDEFMRTVRDVISTGNESKLMLANIDLSDFKYINERYGYAKGNEVLQLLAKTIYTHFDRILACCREYSDNFVLAFRTRSNESKEKLKKRFMTFGGDFLKTAAEMIPNVNMAINIGLSVMDVNGDKLEECVSDANEARKYARDVNADEPVKVALFTADMVKSKLREQELISRLQGALDNGEFRTYFQPKAGISDMTVCGAEALVRWVTQDGSMVYPDEFIPAFEKDGCIVKVDYHVYEDVFGYLRRRMDMNLPNVRISMNVSRVHLFGRAFVSFIKLLQDKYRIPSELLEFEITESVYIDELPALKYTVEALRSRGIKVAIDDFGSGYSSLNILTEIPVDVIKLDRVFMKEKLEQNDKIIIETIIDMSRRLGMEVVCEGVENEEQLEFLKETGCDIIQGFYFSRPVDADSFGKMLTDLH